MFSLKLWQGILTIMTYDKLDPNQIIHKEFLSRNKHIIILKSNTL